MYKFLLGALTLVAFTLAIIYMPQEPRGAAAQTFAIASSIMEDSEGYLVLANKDNLLPSSFKPKNLMNIKVRKTSSTAIQTRSVVSHALDDMFAAAEADGVKLYAHSGYRSYHTQAVMYDNRLARLGKDDGAVQKPGASDHQTGLGIDVISYAWIDKRLNEGFYETKEGKWLDENCAAFGFIIRYPRDKESITGIIYEPWHLRYVGREVAEYIMANGLTLEEFVGEYDDYKANADASSASVAESNEQQADSVYTGGAITLVDEVIIE